MTEKRVKTMKVSGGDYAKVTDRLKEFRNDNPNGLVETVPTLQGEMVVFKARVLKDKSDPASAEATGHAMGPAGGAKAFEKLETIAVGRALALLGYAADGEIASAEEMEEFLAYQNEKKQNAVLEATEQLTNAKNLEELKEVWANLPADIKKEVQSVKEEVKKRYEND